MALWRFKLFIGLSLSLLCQMSEGAMSCPGAHAKSKQQASKASFQNQAQALQIQVDKAQAAHLALLAKIELVAGKDFSFDPEFMARVEGAVARYRAIPKTNSTVAERSNVYMELRAILDEVQSFQFADHADFLIDPGVRQNAILNQKHALYTLIYEYGKFQGSQADTLMYELQSSIRQQQARQKALSVLQLATRLASEISTFEQLQAELVRLPEMIREEVGLPAAIVGQVVALSKLYNSSNVDGLHSADGAYTKATEQFQKIISGTSGFFRNESEQRKARLVLLLGRMDSEASAIQILAEERSQAYAEAGHLMARYKSLVALQRLIAPKLAKPVSILGD